jgi:hypothetical protein
LCATTAVEFGSSSESAEGDREQGRAEQHNAGGRQREKSFGHEIMVTHDTPAILDAGPICQKLGQAFPKKGDAVADA